jgi:hypothetical protein
MLNRNAIILKPKQPFIEWINSHDGEVMTLETILGDLTVFLIPENDSEEDFFEELEHNWSNLFEDELNGWYTDEAMWPQDRTYAMFREWVEVTWHSVVEDLGDGGIVDD